MTRATWNEENDWDKYKIECACTGLLVHVSAPLQRKPI